MSPSPLAGASEPTQFCWHAPFNPKAHRCLTTCSTIPGLGDAGPQTPVLSLGASNQPVLFQLPFRALLWLPPNTSRVYSCSWKLRVGRNQSSDFALIKSLLILFLQQGYGVSLKHAERDLFLFIFISPIFVDLYSCLFVPLCSLGWPRTYISSWLSLPSPRVSCMCHHNQLLM